MTAETGSYRGQFTKLTERQTRALLFVREHHAATGYGPTFREIGDAVGLTSLSSVSYLVRQLAKFGYLHYSPGVPRAITPISASEPTDVVALSQLLSQAITDKLVRKVASAIWYDDERLDMRSSKYIRQNLERVMAEYPDIADEVVVVVRQTS